MGKLGHPVALSISGDGLHALVCESVPQGPDEAAPSQSWRTFLANYAKDIVSIDLFIVLTATFRVLFVFLVRDNVRRRTLHFNVIGSPTAALTRQQIVDVFPVRRGRVRASSR